MFTGIIEEEGIVRSLQWLRSGARLRLFARRLARQLQLGSSLSVNGVCLTVDQKKGRALFLDLSPETLGRSTLGQLKKGQRVNLETSLTLSKPLDGHLVQGHVDAVGRVERAERDSKGQLLEISLPRKFSHYLVEKGSVSVDGVSLTTTWVNGTRFRVSIIPYTARHTTLGGKRPGDPVNIETDLLAKYLEKWVA